MIAKLAYLTSPAPGRYMLNIQPFGTDDVLRFEIAQCHLANIVVDGASFALRESHRVPNNTSQESADGGSGNRAQ
jgi:hypothetical protein